MIWFFDLETRLIWIIGMALGRRGSTEYDPASRDIPGAVLAWGFGVLTAMFLVGTALIAVAFNSSPWEPMGFAALIWLAIHSMGVVQKKQPKPKSIIAVRPGYGWAVAVGVIITLISFAGWIVVNTVPFDMPMDRTEFAGKLLEPTKSGFTFFLGVVTGKAVK